MGNAEYMGSGQLVFSGLTMKPLLVAASIASVALTAPYNPYSPLLLNPYPSLYYNPYNPNGLSSIVSARGYKAVAGDNGDLKGAVHEVPGHYSNAAIAPLASSAQLQKSSNVLATFNAFNSPVHLDGIVPKGKSGNYNGKQQDKIAVLPSTKSALAYLKSYFGDGDLCSESGAAYMKSILSGPPEQRRTLLQSLPTRMPGTKELVSVLEVPVQPPKLPSRKHTALAKVPSWSRRVPSSTTGLASRQATHARCQARRTWTPSSTASLWTTLATSLARLSSLHLEILLAVATQLRTPHVQMRQRPTLNLPTLRTLQVRNLRRLSSTRRCPPPPAATTLSVRQPQSPPWMPLPLARTPSPPTSSLQRPSSRSTPRAPRLLEPTHPVSRRPWATQPTRQLPRRRTRTPCWLSSTRRSTTVLSCSRTPCVAPPRSPTWTPRSPGKATSRLEQIPRKPILRPLLPTME